MYTAYCDGKIFYSPTLFEQGFVVSSPKITYEINKAGSFSFILPPNNPMYDSFKKLKSIITVKDDNTEIWRGRVLDSTRTFFNQKEIVCEGELAFLNDALIPPYDYTENGLTVGELFNLYFQYYRTDLVVERDIKKGLITAVNSSTVIYPKNESYRTILDDMVTNVVNKLEGHLQIRRENGVSYLDYLNTKLNLSDQKVEFGRNLLDLEEYIDASEIYTYLIPFGKKDNNGNPITIESVNNGKNYIRSETGFNLYGRIEKTITWDNITDSTLLKSTAQEELDKAIKESLTITINALDLKYLGVNVSRIRVGQYLTVISEPHSIHDNFLCSKIELNLENPGSSKYSLGGTQKALTSTQAETVKTISNQRITTDWLQEAIDNATAMMTGSRGGYKVTEYDEDGKWLRDLYMNAPNKEDATQVMQINMNGIGFSRDGFDGPYKNAWTIDGTFLGEFIKAGSVQAEALSAEYKSLVTDEINAIATAKFQVADQRITAEVTRASNAEDLLAASINIQADQILQKVSKGDISSELSIESGLISISGPRFSVNTPTFKINYDNVESIGSNASATLYGGGLYLKNLPDNLDAGLIEYNKDHDATCLGGYGAHPRISIGYWAGNNNFTEILTICQGENPPIKFNGPFSITGRTGWTGTVGFVREVTYGPDNTLDKAYGSIDIYEGIITGFSAT